MTRSRLAALAVACGLLLAGCGSGKATVLPLCTAGGIAVTTEQAENAATIAAVGKRLGVPDRGVTVALATALQESGLRNLPYGDRDSLGLFQQRPSQGWGTPEVVSTPRLAAASFYRRLVQVPSWQSLQITEAAQRVQRSAAPDAYAQWESAARTLASALTGEVAAGIACRYPAPTQGPGDPRAAAAAELGPGGLTRAGTPATTWTTASWLVTHAASYRLTSVSVAGRTWTAHGGSWTANPSAGPLAFS